MEEENCWPLRGTLFAAALRLGAKRPEMSSPAFGTIGRVARGLSFRPKSTSHEKLVKVASKIALSKGLKHLIHPNSI